MSNITIGNLTERQIIENYISQWYKKIRFFSTHLLTVLTSSVIFAIEQNKQYITISVRMKHFVLFLFEC